MCYAGVPSHHDYGDLASKMPGNYAFRLTFFEKDCSNKMINHMSNPFAAACQTSLNFRLSVVEAESEIEKEIGKRNKKETFEMGALTGALAMCIILMCFCGFAHIWMSMGVSKPPVQESRGKPVDIYAPSVPENGNPMYGEMEMTLQPAQEQHDQHEPAKHE